MPLEIDAFEVLRAIGSNPETFADMRVEAAKAAKTMVIKTLKGRSLTPQRLGALFRALGEDALALILEGLPARDLKSIVKAIDPHNPGIKTKDIDEVWARRHTLELASGSAQPAPKLAPIPRRGRSKRNKDKEAASPIGSLSMGARRIASSR
jgi:hypothetical protein